VGRDGGEDLEGRAPMLATDERRELGRHAPAGMVPGALQDRRAFPGDGVLPNLPDFYRGAVRLAVRVGMRS